MAAFTIFRGIDPKNEHIKVAIDSSDSIGFAKKLLKLNYSDDFLLLTHNNQLYRGQLVENVSENELPTEKIQLTRINSNILDLAQDLNLDIIYFVRPDGDVYQGSSKSLSGAEDKWKPLQLDVKVKNVFSNNLGVLFLSEELELYGLGDFGCVHNSIEPARIECFQGFKVKKLALGDDFVVVLTQQAKKYSAILPDDAGVEHLLKMGNSTLSTCVWSFGSVNGGHLGTGDHIKRKTINVVLGLQNKGVIDVATGSEHSMALTLSGHVYVWGNNSHQQIVTEMLESVSMPKMMSENILAASCGRNNTITLSDTLNIRNQSSGNSTTITAIELMDHNNIKTFDCEIPLVLAVDKDFFLVNNMALNRTLLKVYNEEQIFIEKQMHIEAILKQHKRALKLDSFDEFYDHHKSLLCLCTTHLESLRRYFFSSNLADILLANAKYSDHFHKVLTDYVSNFCDNYAIDLFTKSTGDLDIIAQISEEIKTIHSQAGRYHTILNLIGLAEQDLEFQTEQWREFQRTSEQQIALACKTAAFWRMYSTDRLRPLKQQSRRFLLSSMEVPLKTTQTNLFSTPQFVLFNDCLVLLQASLVKYSLKLVWLAAIASKRHAIEIITPEETFVVRSPTQEQIKIWYDAMSKAIADVLTPTEAVRNGYRNTDFEFGTKHPKYPCGKYCGEWLNGKLHGIGFLILPTPHSAATNLQSGIFDGHIYNGQFVDNTIKGYGTIDEYAVGDKVTSYFGDFEDGKFNGYGEIQNFKNGDTYKGFFKNGLFHGFGELATTTYTFVGEFSNNHKSGYGVLDDRVGAEKYMGMFLLGKKNGAGFMVKDGDYFEGVFVNDILSEHGIAIFQNGSYFIGDLTLFGPKGRGTFYFCGREIVDEQQIEQPKVIGNTLSGLLSGTWANVKIDNGNLLFNETYPMSPNVSASLVVEAGPLKWFSIFHCWLHYVFGSIEVYKMKNRMLWVKMANFSISMKSKKELRDNNFEQLTPKDIIAEDPPSPIRNGNTLAALQYLRASLSDSKINILNKSFTDFKTTSLNNSSEDLKGMAKGEDTVEPSDVAPPEALDPAEFIPKFGIENGFDAKIWQQLNDFLFESFSNEDHPLGYLANFLINSFSTAYINWKAKPIPMIADIAVKEFESIIERTFQILKVLFPAIPDSPTFVGENAFFTPKVLLYPHLLKDSIHSILFVLFASKCSQKDEIYRQRLQLFEKKSLDAILTYLKVDNDLAKLARSTQFALILDDFRKFKEKFCPFEMLNQITANFQRLEVAKVEVLGTRFAICADHLITLTLIQVLVNQIPQLGAELSMIETLLGKDMEKIMHQQSGYCFTCLKATYSHLTSDAFLT